MVKVKGIFVCLKLLEKVSNWLFYFAPFLNSCMPQVNLKKSIIQSSMKTFILKTDRQLPIDFRSSSPIRNVAMLLCLKYLLTSAQVEHGKGSLIRKSYWGEVVERWFPNRLAPLYPSSCCLIIYLNIFRRSWCRLAASSLLSCLLHCCVGKLIWFLHQ